EARLTAQLSHPHIAQVYDFGKVDGTYYLAMEWVDGASLRELLSSAALPLPWAVRLASQTAQALEHAHTATGVEGAPLRLVHRDVCPSNVLVSSSGLAKLIDFGIAKSVAAVVNTRTGDVRGTPRYMSPEQLAGRPLDGRSDVFSLGLVLFE